MPITPLFVMSGWWGDNLFVHPSQMKWGQAARTGCVRPGLGSLRMRTCSLDVFLPDVELVRSYPEPDLIGVRVTLCRFNLQCRNCLVDE